MVRPGAHHAGRGDLGAALLAGQSAVAVFQLLEGLGWHAAGGGTVRADPGEQLTAGQVPDPEAAAAAACAHLHGAQRGVQQLVVARQEATQVQA
jgi:hypothetical protein